MCTNGGSTYFETRIYKECMRFRFPSSYDFNLKLYTDVYENVTIRMAELVFFETFKNYKVQFTTRTFVQ